MAEALDRRVPGDVEDQVIRFRAAREVSDRVVDHLIGAEGTREVHLGAAAHATHVGTEGFGDLHRVSITVAGYDPTVVVMDLRRHHIHTAPPGRATSFHDLADRELEGIVRVSPHYYNTTEEIDRLAETLATEFPPT